MKKKEMVEKKQLDDRDWKRLEKAKKLGLAVQLFPKEGKPEKRVIGRVASKEDDLIELGDGEKYHLLASSNFRMVKIVPTYKLLAEILHLSQENKELKQVLHRSR